MTTVANISDRNNKAINAEVISRLSDDVRRWVKRAGTLQELTAKRSVARELSTKQMAQYIERATAACVAAYDKAMLQAAERKAQEKAEKAAKRAAAKHEKMMNACVDDPKRDSCYNVLMALRWGEHHDEIKARYADHNGVTCSVVRDFDGYARSCQWTMIRRGFTLNIKKGYRVRVVGGLITFFRGNFSREGMACEWVEQGRAIDDIITVKGYLVRGEHIKAKSLAAAKKINAEHRAEALAAILKERTKTAKKIEALKDYSFTFQDSLDCGNCRPGSAAFKTRYELAIGHEAETISATDLDKYGKRFGLSTYTDRLINYVYNKRK